MTKTTATLVTLLFFCAIARGQIFVNVQSTDCHVLTAVIGSSAAPLKENQHFVCWLERQIAPGIWEMKDKKYAKTSTVIFEDVPVGIYRAGAAVCKADPLVMQTDKTVTEDRAGRSMVEVRACENEHHLSLELSEKNILLYPNPATDALHFFLSAGELMPNARLELNSADGRVVRSVNITNLAQIIDVGTLPSGTYTARIFQEARTVFNRRIAIARR